MMSRTRRHGWWLLPILGIAAASACTAINDSNDFVIDPPSIEARPLTPEGDCRLAGVAGRCKGEVPQRCAATGDWQDAGAACVLGCRSGVCYECTPGTGECIGSERIRRQCSDAGVWVNSAPCGLDSPYCFDGSCLACAPSQRSCIGNIPQSCGTDGQWHAEAACPATQNCEVDTGACKQCSLGEVRTCNNVLGNCARGTKSCQPDGSWSACSISPAEDACEPTGDDGSCDGIPNQPSTPCALECTAAIACGPASNVGICRTGTSACTAGVLGKCEGAVWPQLRDCRSPQDNDCNGTPDNLDATCITCDANDTALEVCPSSLYPDLGICEAQVRRCLTTTGGTTSYWEACWGGVAPQTRNCASHDDNDCNGTPDDKDASCSCTEGVSRPCSAAACSGLQRCNGSDAGDATYWGECELPSAWSFSEPERVAGLGVSGDLWGPAQFEDGVRLAFSAGTPEHIYIADRIAGAEFAAASLLGGAINGGMTDGTPFVTASGQALYFDSRRREGGGRDIWRAALNSGGWGAPELVANVNSERDEQNPWVSPDERLLVFNSDRSGDADLWAATWNAGAFGAPVPLGELNSSASDEGATLTRDGLTVFFASNRPGGSGGLDIWVSSRDSTAEPFSTPRNLAAINTSDDELDLALGPDGQELFFASSRDEGYQLYRARRGCE